LSSIAKLTFQTAIFNEDSILSSVEVVLQLDLLERIDELASSTLIDVGLVLSTGYEVCSGRGIRSARG
jgi:hypothetical protein